MKVIPLHPEKGFHFPLRPYPWAASIGHFSVPTGFYLFMPLDILGTIEIHVAHSNGGDLGTEMTWHIRLFVFNIKVEDPYRPGNEPPYFALMEYIISTSFHALRTFQGLVCLFCTCNFTTFTPMSRHSHTISMMLQDSRSAGTIPYYNTTLCYTSIIPRRPSYRSGEESSINSSWEFIIVLVLALRCRLAKP